MPNSKQCYGEKGQGDGTCLAGRGRERDLVRVASERLTSETTLCEDVEGTRERATWVSWGRVRRAETARSTQVKPREFRSTGWWWGWSFRGRGRGGDTRLIGRGRGGGYITGPCKDVGFSPSEMGIEWRPDFRLWLSWDPSAPVLSIDAKESRSGTQRSIRRLRQGRRSQ